VAHEQWAGRTANHPSCETRSDLQRQRSHAAGPAGDIELEKRGGLKVSVAKWGWGGKKNAKGFNKLKQTDSVRRGGTHQGRTDKTRKKIVTQPQLQKRGNRGTCLRGKVTGGSVKRGSTTTKPRSCGIQAPRCRLFRRRSHSRRARFLKKNGTTGGGDNPSGNRTLIKTFNIEKREGHVAPWPVGHRAGCGRERYAGGR